MIKLDDLNYKIVYEDKLSSIIANNNIDATKFYSLENFKNQISSRKTEFHFDEIVYHLSLLDNNKNVIKTFITSYEKKFNKEKINFFNEAKKINGTFKADTQVVHIGDIYILGEFCDTCNNIIPPKTYDRELLNKLNIAYVISDPDTGNIFKYESFFDCVSSIITYMHYTTVNE